MASDTCTITINGEHYKARLGDTLLDAGLTNRIILPHDCCSGQCETCRVRLVSGDIDDCGTREKDSVLGCLATIEGDAEIAYDPVPIARTTKGRVTSIETIGPDLLQVRLRMSKPVPWLPGQYVRLKFKGFEPRDYSPTFALDLDAEEDVLVFHIKVYELGQLSSAFGDRIVEGHKVAVTGPFGNAFLRRQRGRLILVSTGTGFAPLWSIAVAATKRGTDQPVTLVAGCRRERELYMKPAIQWLRDKGVPVILTAADGDGETVLTARPQELMPALGPTDLVYAAGAPIMVDAVRETALAADAGFYADPFFAAEPKIPFLHRVLPGFISRRPVVDSVSEESAVQ